jgi:hypothetical protein
VTPRKEKNISMGQALSKSEVAQISHGVKRRMGQESPVREQNGRDAPVAPVVGGALRRSATGGPRYLRIDSGDAAARLGGERMIPGSRGIIEQREFFWQSASGRSVTAQAIIPML